jgi:hypothetical protein
MNMTELAESVNQIADYAKKLGTPAGEIAYMLLHFGAVIIRKGGDPVTHLSRLLDLEPSFDAISKATDAAAHAKFTEESK